jgi:hypothetical protein
MREDVTLLLLGNFVKTACLVIPDQLAHRMLIEHVKHFAKLFSPAASGCKAVAVGPAQRADQGVAVLSANLTVLIAVSFVQSRLFH